MYSNLVSKEDYKKHLQDVINQHKILHKIKNILYSNNISDKTLTKLMRSYGGAGVKQIATGMILEGAYKSEINGGNSSDIYLAIVSHLIECGIKNINFENSYEDLKNSLEKNKIQLNIEILNNIIKNSVKSDLLSEMIIESINLSGLEGRIYPTSSKSNKHSVELVEGYSFPAASYPELYKNGRWANNFPKVLIVDGIIERESEIDVLLHEIYEEKTPILIVARGYGEEVIGTLSQNIINGTLNILPIRIPYELESINLITDIAVVCGTDPVNTQKGDIVSSVRLNKLVEVEQIVADSNGILTIVNSSTRKSVQEHAKNLIDKRNEQNVDMVSDLLNARIRSMCSHCVYLRIGGASDIEKSRQLEMIDYGLRTVKSALAHGVVKLSDVFKFSTGEIKNSIREFETNYEYRPTLSVLSAIHHAISVAKTLMSIECAILID